VLAHRLSYPTVEHQQWQQVRIDIPLQISGTDIGPHEVAYLPSTENTFRIGYTNISNLHQAKQQFLQSLAPQNTANNIDAQILREKIQRKFGIQIHSTTISQELVDKLPDDFTYMLEYSDVSAGMSHLFVGYQIRRAEKLMDGQSEEKILEELASGRACLLSRRPASSGASHR
jgi:hypothetical protein